MDYAERNRKTLVTAITAIHIRHMLTFSVPVCLSFALVLGGQTAKTGRESRPDSLKSMIERRIAEVPGAVAGVAFHDLGSGDTLFVNADDGFHAASTMKVPVMIELFRRIDAGALSLDQGILLVNEFGSIVDGSPYHLDAGDDSDSSAYAAIGKRVPVRELIDRMITR